MINAWIRRRKERRFLGRDPRTFEEIFELFFSHKRYDSEVCKEQWNKMAELLNLNPKLLLPSDRFDLDLSPVSGFRVDDELEDLSEWVNDQLKDKRSKRLACELMTLGEVIDALNGPGEC